MQNMFRVLGMDNMLKYKLIYKTKGYTQDYHEDVDPSVLNGHATAAFRYFHSAIQGRFQWVIALCKTYGKHVEE